VSKRRTSFQDLCYGIPVDLIATWCCVDIQTARHYKAGTRSPGRPARELFTLQLNGRVVPEAWDGFSFRDGKMFDPYGKELSHGILRAYPIALQLMREWARDDNARTRALDELFYTGQNALQFPSSLHAVGAVSDDEAKPSALVRDSSPETQRRRLRQRPATREVAAPLETGSTEVPRVPPWCDEERAAC